MPSKDGEETKEEEKKPTDSEAEKVRSKACAVGALFGWGCGSVGAF